MQSLIDSINTITDYMADSFNGDPEESAELFKQIMSIISIDARSKIALKERNELRSRLKVYSNDNVTKKGK